MEKNNKEKKITVRLSEKEHEILQEKSTQTGKKPSQYLRSLLHSSNQSEVDMITLQELTTQLQNLKNCIKAIDSKGGSLSETLNQQNTKENKIHQQRLSKQIKSLSNESQETLNAIQEGIMTLWESLN